MADHIVGDVGDIRESAGSVFDVGGRSIGVFRKGDEFFALLNRCPHQGGPLCEGGIFPMSRAEWTLGRVREWLDHDTPVLACPWHGWEFDLATGVCLADPARRVMSYPVTVRDGKIVVTLPDRSGAQPAARSEGR